MDSSRIDRRAFIAKLGGAATVAGMSASTLADELEDELIEATTGPEKAEEQPAKPVRRERAKMRRGAGGIFDERRVPELSPLPANPTLIDFFKHRFGGFGVHGLRSAQHALDSGQDEIHVMAALVHDTVQALVRADHGYWGADFLAPYVDERIAWGIRYHQALRFFPDESVGYEYPALYVDMFGADFEPEPYVHAAYADARKHRWYMHARMITVNDTYGFDKNVNPAIDEFTDIIGRNFRQPSEGLGNDVSPAAHMWRTLINPDRPL